MKSTVKSLIVVMVLFPLLFSCNRKSNLEHNLELAGKNRPELEKVLEHYKNDPLKLKAAKYLIENIDTYYSFTSPELDVYYHTLDSIFQLNKFGDMLTPEQQTLLSSLNQPNQNNFKNISDLQSVSSKFLIDNIERAFKAWKSPFAQGLNFDDFCEYLLPYKAGSTDRPDYWQTDFYNTFHPYVKYCMDTLVRLDSGIILNYPSLVMDGKNFLTLPERLFDSVPEFSVSCWVKPDESKIFARVFEFGKGYPCYVGFMPYTDGKVSEFEVMTDNPHDWKTVKSDSLPLNKRSQVVMTYVNNYISFYIDGVLKQRMRTTLTNKDLTVNYIGKSHYDNDTVRFKGRIDSFHIYNRELNYAEICSLAGKKDTLTKRDRLIDVVKGIRDLINETITLDPLIPGGYRPTQLINLRKGSCDDYTVLTTYIFRSLGIPSTIDFIPQWATRSVGHSWNALYTGGKRLEDYSFGDDRRDTIGIHIKTHYEKAAKIFRHTYAKQENCLAIQNDDKEVLPQTFQNPCMRDVTDSYLDCKDVTVSLTLPHSRKINYAYLCNFNDQDWIPVFWGKIEGNKVTFTKMGKDVAFLPVYYNQLGVQPAGDPFILTKEGEIKKLIPDHLKTQTMILKRKYKSGNVPEKGKLLVGGKFQVANKADFSDSLTVYTVNDIPEINYNSVNLNLNKPYRYFRFWSPQNSQGGEISEIEIYSSDSTKLTGTVIGNKHCDAGWEAENAFDGDPLTSYQCVWGEQGWVGLDFGKPIIVSYFRYLPRNDDNFIKEGEEYELFYWENYQWNSLGKQTGTSKQYLEYTNVPTNALFLLRDLTKGKQERIFTYENSQQVWW